MNTWFNLLFISPEAKISAFEIRTLGVIKFLSLQFPIFIMRYLKVQSILLYVGILQVANFLITVNENAIGDVLPTKEKLFYLKFKCLYYNMILAQCFDYIYVLILRLLKIVWEFSVKI